MRGRPPPHSDPGRCGRVAAAPAREKTPMPLVDLEIPRHDGRLPAEVRRLIRDADRRIADFQIWSRVPAFVPSNFEPAYRVLRGVADAQLARGTRFCEWGSGYGAVTCLASLLDWEAVGIEVEAELVAEARRLADDHGLTAEFVAGSFVPRGGEARVLKAGEYAWFTTTADDAYDELGLGPDDMDLVFAYPWPDEEGVTADLFDRYAGPGALLVTFHGGDDFRLRRKRNKKKPHDQRR